jgi:hypothetical protein
MERGERGGGGGRGGREGDTLERAFDCQLDSTPPVEVTRDVHV